MQSPPATGVTRTSELVQAKSRYRPTLSIYLAPTPAERTLMTPLDSPSSRADVKSAAPSPDAAGEELAPSERREAPTSPAAEEVPVTQPFGTGLRSRLGGDNSICW